jgi:hypothetical protein
MLSTHTAEVLQLRAERMRGSHDSPDSTLRGGCLDYSLFESALRDENLPQIPKHLLLYLIFRANETDTCFGSQNRIAKQLAYHRQRINEATTWLREAGYIDTRSKGRILTYDLSATRTRYSPTCPPGGHHLSAPRTSTCPPSGHRTRIEQAFKDKNGLYYRITPERTRAYLTAEETNLFEEGLNETK